LRQKGKSGSDRQYQNALQIDPNDPQVLNILAWLLATCSDVSLRNGSKRWNWRQANALSGGSNPFSPHMAAASRKPVIWRGRESEQKAIELARAAGDKTWQRNSAAS